MDDKKTILVVDDMSQIRHVLRFSLKKEGFAVVLAGSGKEALDRAVDPYNRPDLVLLDVMMPRMDGYEVIRKLRKSATTRRIPVIFLTAKAQKDDVVKGIEAGADDYILKPYKFTDLLSKIKKHIVPSSVPRGGKDRP